MEVFPNENSNVAEKYLAKVFSIKEDVIEAVLLADDRPVKEHFFARLTGTTGRVRVGFDLLGRTVDALGALLDSFSETENTSIKKLDKNRLKNFFAITDFYNFNSKFNSVSKKKINIIRLMVLCILVNILLLNMVMLTGKYLILHSLIVYLNTLVPHFQDRKF